MCLTNDVKLTEMLLSGYQKTFKGFKVIVREKQDSSYLYRSYYRSEYVWKNGINVAQKASLKDRQEKTIFYGFHCYRTLEAARKILLAYTPFNVGKELKIIYVKGQLEDLIGANYSELIFKKVNFILPKVLPKESVDVPLQ